MKLHCGWVVVAVGALATCIGMGATFSLPVFRAPIAAETTWLYIGSFGIGLGAAAIALAFPPVRGRGARPLSQAA